MTTTVRMDMDIIGIMILVVIDLGIMDHIRIVHILFILTDLIINNLNGGNYVHPLLSL
jgi:hypothetical protein